jgi:hypothetical protein
MVSGGDDPVRLLSRRNDAKRSIGERLLQLERIGCRLRRPLLDRFLRRQDNGHGFWVDGSDLRIGVSCKETE